MANFNFFELFAINKGLIRQNKAVREQALRLPGDFIGLTRKEQFVQWRPIRDR
jgi:hypothetical protein